MHRCQNCERVVELNPDGSCPNCKKIVVEQAAKKQADWPGSK